MSSLTRSRRFFTALISVFRLADDGAGGATEKRTSQYRFPAGASERLRHFLERVALDDVADFVFVEIAEFRAALLPAADFFHVVLEMAERGKAAVVNGAGGCG
jgi:hypothetical protein